MFTFLKTNTDKISSGPSKPTEYIPDAKANKDLPVGERFSRIQFYYSYHLPQNLDGTRGNSCAKIGDPPDEIFPPPRSEHVSKEARWASPEIQGSDDIISLTLHPEEEVRTPEGRILHRWYPKAPLSFLPAPRLKKRVSQDESDRI